MHPLAAYCALRGCRMMVFRIVVGDSMRVVSPQGRGWLVPPGQWYIGYAETYSWRRGAADLSLPHREVPMDTLGVAWDWLEQNGRVTLESFLKQ